MKKKIGVVAVVVEILTCLMLVGMSAPKMFGCAMLFYPVTACVTLLGVYLTITSFTEGYGVQEKAASIGIFSAGIASQVGLFGVCEVVEKNSVFYGCLIAISCFAAGQYICALFRTENN